MWQRRRLDREMAEEMRFHLQMEAEREAAKGLPPEEARRAAERNFGNVGSIQERSREQRGWLLLESLQRDARLALRVIARQPGFAAVVVLTLSLGIGVNTAIFSVANAVLLRPLAVRGEARLVVLQTVDHDNGKSDAGLSYPDFADWRKSAGAFEKMGIAATTGVVVNEPQSSWRANAAVVSPDLLLAAGVQAELGRRWREDEETGGAGPMPVLLSHSLWVSRFNSDRGVVGKPLRIADAPAQIVGVMPDRLFPVQPEPVDLWVPAAYFGDPAKAGTANASRSYRPYLGALARLKPGVRLEAARAELEVLQASIRAKHPELGKNQTVSVVPLRQYIFGDLRPKLGLTAGIAGIVLLIACVNVANLLLGRAVVRQRELAVRSALGASRSDLIRHSVVETLVLAAFGGAAGLLVALWLLAGLRQTLPESLPRLAEIPLDGTVLWFALAVTGVTGVMCGLWPALAGGAAAPGDALKSGGRAGGNTGRTGMRGALIVGQVALTLPLMIAAGWVLQSFGRLQKVDPGYRTEGILTANLALAGAHYVNDTFDPTAINALLRRLTERLQAIPGVTAVSYAQCVPLTGAENSTSFSVVEKPGDPARRPTAQLRFVGADYFATMGIRLVGGRSFTERDDARAPAVAIVNEAFVREELAGRDPLASHLKLGWGGFKPKQIVGVVADVRHRSLDDSARPEVYVPQTQFANGGITVILRTSLRAEALAETLRQEMWRLDANSPLTDIRTLASYREGSTAGLRFGAATLAASAGLALVLTIVGLYGVMSHNVAGRRREMGVRAALGARPADLYRMLLGQSLRLVGAGIALGVVLALILSGFARSEVFGIGAGDATTYVLPGLLVAAVSALATWVPARRATKVDPVEALRAE